MVFNKVLASTVAVVFSTITQLSHAQSIRYEAVQLVEMTMQSNWENVKPLLALILEKMDADMATREGLEASDRVLADEMRKSFNREGFSKALATSISGAMTEAELKETLAFYRSPVGQKWLQYNSSQEFKDGFLKYLIKNVCEGAKARLSPADQKGRTFFELCK